MRLEQIDSMWLDAHHEVSLAELVQLSRLSEAELRELVDYGVLAPTDPQGVEWTFGGDIVVTMRAAGRLRDDLELEPQALALALTLIGRIRDLEAQLCSLRAQLPRRSP
jgi:chaperone modulatory protein CbpM